MNAFRVVLSLLLSFLLIAPSTSSPIAARRIDVGALERRGARPAAPPTFGPDPTLKHFVTATLNLGPRFPLVDIPAGKREAQPVNGTVAGPGLNGTIINGIAYPTIVNNQTTAFVDLLIYGETDDKVPFLIQSSGVGSPSKQYVSLSLEIGGRYKRLADTFIIASISRPADATAISVSAFEVL